MNIFLAELMICAGLEEVLSLFTDSTSLGARMAVAFILFNRHLDGVLARGGRGVEEESCS